MHMRIHKPCGDNLPRAVYYRVGLACAGIAYQRNHAVNY